MTPEQEKQLMDSVATLSTTVGQLQQGMQKVEQFPGWITRLESKVDGLGKKQDDPPKPDDKKPEDKKPDDKTDGPWRAEIDALNQRIAEKDKRLAISEAFAKAGIKWEDPDYVMDKLTAQITSDGDSYVVKTKERLKETGAEIAVTKTPSEWLQDFAKAHPKLVGTGVKDGSGAGGEAPKTTSADELFGNLTHGELMKDPKRYAAALKLDPARMKKLQEDADRARQKK